MALATARLRRRSALLLLMAVFIVGDLLCAVATGYGWLMVARVVGSRCPGQLTDAADAYSFIPQVTR